MKIIRSILMSLFMLLISSSVCFAKTNDVQLTQSEQNFIKEHPEVHLGVDPKFIPYEFIDTDGEYKGIAADYIQLISDRTGIKMVIQKDITWSDAYEKAVQKQLDVIPCVSKTKEREQYFLYSEPYYAFQRVVFLKANNATIKTLDDLMNKQVAVQTNSSHHSFMKTFDSIKLSTYTTVEEALQAVADEKEVAFVGNYATSSYLIKSNGITDLKYIKINTEENQSLYFAVRNDWPELVSIINKSLASITEEEKITINNRWIGIDKKIDYGQIILNQLF